MDKKIFGKFVKIVGTLNKHINSLSVQRGIGRIGLKERTGPWVFYLVIMVFEGGRQELETCWLPAKDCLRVPLLEGLWNLMLESVHQAMPLPSSGTIFLLPFTSWYSLKESFQGTNRDQNTHGSGTGTFHLPKMATKMADPISRRGTVV